MKPRIVVVIKKGMLQEVHSNTDVEVALVDYDVMEVDGNNPVEFYENESLFKSGNSYKLFEDEKIVEELKKANF